MYKNIIFFVKDENPDVLNFTCILGLLSLSYMSDILYRQQHDISTFR